MALNIAVPLTTVGELIDGFGLLSPISPLSVDCHGVATAGNHGKKQLVSPVGSESSGVSSLDSDEIKKPSSPPTTPTEEVERPTTTSSPLPLSVTSDPDNTTIATEASETKSSSCSSTRSSLSSTDSISSSDINSSDESVTTVPVPELSASEPIIPIELKVEIGGRNVLNLLDNLTSPDHFRLQFAQLPENDNIHFFLDNRSQYHRLGANGHIQEYTMVKCKCCDFRYPVNGTSPTPGGTTASSIGQANLAAIFQQHQTQQQQQQQPLQWNSFSNYDSISNRNKLGLNVANSAFNKTFGGGGNNGSQYFRNNMAASLFGRDSNRNSNNNNSGGNFPNNNSTSTYNNHKAYQQGFGTTSNNGNNKFSNPYLNYQFQQQSQQQQLFSKNHQMRYGSGNGNGSGGYNTSAAVAAAASALASQNMLNLNNFNGKNNNNMFAHYKAMMN